MCLQRCAHLHWKLGVRGCWPHHALCAHVVCSCLICTWYSLKLLWSRGCVSIIHCGILTIPGSWHAAGSPVDTGHTLRSPPGAAKGVNEWSKFRGVLVGDPAGGPKDTAPATAKAKSGDPVQAQNWGASLPHSRIWDLLSGNPLQGF